MSSDVGLIALISACLDEDDDSGRIGLSKLVLDLL